MNLNEIIDKIEDARMQYAEAQVRHFHVAEEKQRYANLLINYAPELLAAARKSMEAEAVVLAQLEVQADVIRSVTSNAEAIVANPSAQPQMTTVEQTVSGSAYEINTDAVSVVGSRSPRKKG